MTAAARRLDAELLHTPFIVSTKPASRPNRVTVVASLDQMSPFKRKSDEEFVDSLRTSQRYRRPIGVTLIVIAVALVSLHIWGEVWMRHKALDIASALDALSRRPGAASANACDPSSAMSYATGLRSGFLLAQGAFVAAIFLAGGIRLRFGGRKERLLIQHFNNPGSAASNEH